MFKTISKMKVREEKGFTLIELLIVVAIIGILAAIAIPGYIGMQEKARKGALNRSATSVVPELQAWLQSARGGIGTAKEIDTNFNGSVEATDLTNTALLAAGVDATYVTNRLAAMSEKSPWSSSTPLWVVVANDTGGTNTTYAGQIVISSTTMGLRVIGRDNSGVELVNKIVTAE